METNIPSETEILVPPKVRGGARERLAATRAAEAEAEKRAALEVEARKLAKKIAAEELAATQLGEKRRAKQLLGLKGYWRPSSVFVSDSRYAQDFEIMVNVQISKAIKDRAQWELINSTSGHWIEGEGDEMWLFGATIFDKEGELCYTYQRIKDLPKTDTSGGIQLAVPIDEAQLFRLKMREKLKQWAKLLSFRDHCYALVALADMVKDKAAVDEANRKLAIEAARLERERQARERQPGALPKDYKEGFELGAMKELARLALQIHRGPITNSEPPELYQPRNAGVATNGVLFHSSLPALREPANLDALDEANQLPLHPLGDFGDCVPKTQSSHPVTSPSPSMTSPVPRRSNSGGFSHSDVFSEGKGERASLTEQGSGWWDLQALLEEFPELAGVLRSVLGPLSTPELAEKLPLPQVLEKSRLDAAPVQPPEWTAAGPICDGSEVSVWNGESSDEDSEDSSYLGLSINNPIGQTQCSDMRSNFIFNSSSPNTSPSSIPKTECDQVTDPLGSKDNNVTSSFQSPSIGTNGSFKNKLSKSQSLLFSVFDEKSQDDSVETKSKLNDQEDSTIQTNEVEQSLQLPPVAMPLPFLPSDFPYGECTLYAIGNNKQEQVAELDQVVGANLAWLKMDELNKERERHEALKASLLERGEDVSDSEDEYQENSGESDDDSIDDEDDVGDDDGQNTGTQETADYSLDSKEFNEYHKKNKHVRRRSFRAQQNLKHLQKQHVRQHEKNVLNKPPPASRLVFTPQMLSTPQRMGVRKDKTVIQQQVVTSPTSLVSVMKSESHLSFPNSNESMLNGARSAVGSASSSMKRPHSYSSLASRSAKLAEMKDIHDSSKEAFASVMPSITVESSHALSAAHSANMHTTYDPLSWKGRLIVKDAGKEAKFWFKVSRPLARPADPYPLQHEDYMFSHARERIVCVALGNSISATITRQGRLYTWGDNAHGQLGRREISVPDPVQQDGPSTSSSSSYDTSVEAYNSTVSHGSSFVDQHVAVDYSQPPISSTPTSSSLKKRSHSKERSGSRDGFASVSFREFEGSVTDESSLLDNSTPLFAEGSKNSVMFAEGSKNSVIFADIQDGEDQLEHKDAMGESIRTDGKRWDELEGPMSPATHSKSFMGEFNGQIRPVSSHSRRSFSGGPSSARRAAGVAVDRMGLDGGGLPLRCGLGRVLCSFGPHQRVIAISCGVSHAITITSLGKIYTFGSNHQGQLGLDRSPSLCSDEADTARPQLVTSLSDRVAVWCGAGDNFSACIVLDNNNSSSSKGYNPEGLVNQRVYTCGANDHGQLGLGGTFLNERMNGAGGTDINGYDTTQPGTCVRSFKAVVILPPLPAAVTPLHSLSSFSHDEHKQQVLTQLNSPTPYPASMIEGGTGSVPRAMSCGGRHCALITMDGRLISWGANDFGQLGRGFFTGDEGSGADGGIASSAESEVSRQQEKVKADEAVKLQKQQAAAEKKHSAELELAKIKKDNETATEKPKAGAPKPTAKRKYRFKAAVDAVMAVEKMTHAAAALDAATVRREKAAQNTGRPAEVDFADIVEARDGNHVKGIVARGADAVAEKAMITVVCGGDHTIVARKDRTVWSCGRNHRGQLGLGKVSAETNGPGVWVDRTYSFKEIPALRGLGTSALSAGYAHSFAMTASEECFMWGSVSSDPLQAVHTPQIVPLLSGRQAVLPQPSGSACHSLVTTFDVLGPLIIVFDILAAKEILIPEPTASSSSSSVAAASPTNAPSKLSKKLSQFDEDDNNMTAEEKRTLIGSNYLLDWRYIGRCIHEGKWNSSGNLLWAQKDGIFWDATKRGPPTDPTTAMISTAKFDKIKQMKARMKKKREMDEEHLSGNTTSCFSPKNISSSYLSSASFDEPMSPLRDEDEEDEEILCEEMKRKTTGSVRLVMNKFVQDQILLMVQEKLKDPVIRDSEDSAQLALSSHASSLVKAEQFSGDMTSHIKKTENILLHAKNIVAEKRRLEKLQECLKDGFVWDGEKKPRTPKYEFTEFMDSPMLPIDHIDTRADSLLQFEHRMSSPSTPLLTSRSRKRPDASPQRVGASDGGGGGGGSRGMSRQGSLNEEDWDRQGAEPLSGGSTGQWSTTSERVVGTPIDPDLELFSNASLEVLKEAGFDLRTAKITEPLSPISPLMSSSKSSSPAPMLRKMSSRRRSSRSSRAMEAMIAEEELNIRKKEVSDGATIGSAMLWSRMAAAPRRVLMVSASEKNYFDGEEGATRIKAYKNLGLGACTVTELKTVLTTIVKETPGEEMPQPSDFGDLSGHDVLVGEEEIMAASASSNAVAASKSPGNLSRKTSLRSGSDSRPGSRGNVGSRGNSRPASRNNSRPGSRDSRPGSRGNSVERLSSGWHRHSRRSSRPSSAVAGSETGSTIGEDAVDLDTAMVSSASLRRALARVGAWTISGKPQPLPPPLPAEMQQAIDRMEARKRGEVVDEPSDFGSSSSNNNSRPSTPSKRGGLSMIHSLNQMSAMMDYSDGDSSQSIQSASRHSKLSKDGKIEEGTRSILPTLFDGDKWFKDEASALHKLRSIEPMVKEWRAKESEDGFPIPSVLEELVEKNGLAAALNHGWWRFVGEFVLITALVPRWRSVVALQLQAARVRLHSDVRGTDETRAGGFLCPVDNDDEAYDEEAEEDEISDNGDQSDDFMSPFRSLNPDGSYASEDISLHEQTKITLPFLAPKSYQKINTSEVFDITPKTDDVLEAEWFCCCGTCSKCQLIAAKKVSERLYVANNNALGPIKAKEMKLLNEKLNSSTYVSRCLQHLSDTCKLILKENPLFSDDQVRRYILQSDDQILIDFQKDHPKAFTSFTDRRLAHK